MWSPRVAEGRAPIPQAAETQGFQGWEGPVGLHVRQPGPRGGLWEGPRRAWPPGGRGPQEERGLACEILPVGWGWGYFGAKWEELQGGARAVGTRRSPALWGSAASGLTGSCSLRHPALILESWTSCDLVGVLGPCPLSRNGVLSLQARLSQRPFSGWRWGCPLRGGGLEGTGGGGHWEARRSRGQIFSV